MAEELRRRSEDQPKYSEADFQRFRDAVLESNRVSNLSEQVSRLGGELSGLPSQMEAIARRVFAEQWSVLQRESQRQSQEAAGMRWRRADTVIAMGQFLLAAAVFLALHK